MYRSFSLIETIFVLLILSILSIFTIIKFSNINNFLYDISFKIDVYIIKNYIQEYKTSSLLNTGTISYPSNLDDIINELKNWSREDSYYIYKDIKCYYNNLDGSFSCK